MPNNFNRLMFITILLGLGTVGANAELIEEKRAPAVTPVANVTTSGEVASPMRGPVIHVPNSPGPDSAANDGGIPSQVATAFARLHYVNMMEIEAGRLAWQKGQSKSVRDYGERLMRDHQINDRRLMAFVADNNIAIDRAPAVMAEQAAKDAEMTRKLTAAAPADFDRLFLKEMSAGHANTVNELTGAIDQMADRTARNFLNKVRPILVQHEKLGNILLEKSS